MVIFDYEKCIGCMTCVSVCPFTVIKTDDGRPLLNAGKKCMECTHCAAACPQKAIDFEDGPGIREEEIQKLPEGFHGDLESYLLTRRSYRHFSDVGVPKEITEHALQMAEWAPSAKNQHPAKWIVINDRAVLSKMMELILDYVKETGTSPEIVSEYDAGNNVVLGTAKTIILAYAKTGAINPPVDSALALHTAELILQAEGIGTCWAGYLTRMANAIPALRELVGLPEGSQFYCALLAGYPENEDYLHIPARHKIAEIKWI